MLSTYFQLILKKAAENYGQQSCSYNITFETFNNVQLLYEQSSKLNSLCRLHTETHQSVRHFVRGNVYRANMYLFTHFLTVKHTEYSKKKFMSV